MGNTINPKNPGVSTTVSGTSDTRDARDAIGPNIGGVSEKSTLPNVPVDEFVAISPPMPTDGTHRPLLSSAETELGKALKTVYAQVERDHIYLLPPDLAHSLYYGELGMCVGKIDEEDEWTVHARATYADFLNQYGYLERDFPGFFETGTIHYMPPWLGRTGKYPINMGVIAHELSHRIWKHLPEPVVKEMKQAWTDVLKTTRSELSFMHARMDLANEFWARLLEFLYERMRYPFLRKGLRHDEIFALASHPSIKRLLQELSLVELHTKLTESAQITVIEPKYRNDRPRVYKFQFDAQLFGYPRNIFFSFSERELRNNFPRFISEVEHAIKINDPTASLSLSSFTYVVFDGDNRGAVIRNPNPNTIVILGPDFDPLSRPVISAGPVIVLGEALYLGAITDSWVHGSCRLCHQDLSFLSEEYPWVKRRIDPYLTEDGTLSQSTVYDDYSILVLPKSEQDKQISGSDFASSSSAKGTSSMAIFPFLAALSYGSNVEVHQPVAFQDDATVSALESSVDQVEVDQTESDEVTLENEDDGLTSGLLNQRSSWGMQTPVSPWTAMSRVPGFARGSLARVIVR